MWKNNVFHHLLHFRRVQFFARIWTERSTAFICIVIIMFDCFRLFYIDISSHIDTFSFLATITKSLSLLVEVRIVSDWSVALPLLSKAGSISIPPHASPRFPSYPLLSLSFFFILEVKHDVCDKRQRAKMKPLPSDFSCLYSTVKIFVFVVNNGWHFSTFLWFI